MAKDCLKNMLSRRQLQGFVGAALDPKEPQALHEIASHTAHLSQTDTGFLRSERCDFGNLGKRLDNQPTFLPITFFLSRERLSGIT